MLVPVRVPHSNAFLDFNGDFTAGTVLFALIDKTVIIVLL